VTVWTVINTIIAWVKNFATIKAFVIYCFIPFVIIKIWRYRFDLETITVWEKFLPIVIATKREFFVTL